MFPVWNPAPFWSSLPNFGFSQGRKVENSKVQYVHDKESFEAFQVSPKQVKTDITVTIEGAPVQVCIDSGATANTIDCATYEGISAIKATPLKPTNVRRRPYGEDIPVPIPLAGSFFGVVQLLQGRWMLLDFLY